MGQKLSPAPPLNADKKAKAENAVGAPSPIAREVKSPPFRRN